MSEKIFDNCQQNRLPGETDQQHMKRIINKSLIQTGSFDKGIHDMLSPELVACDPEEKILKLKFRINDWMLNPMRILHGGIMTTCCDMTMGLLTEYLLQSQKCVTVNLNMNFLRSAEADSTIVITAKAEKQGRRIQFLSAQVSDEKSEQLLADCTAVFM